MAPKPIGIIGGAGPMAGAFFLERIFFLSGKHYGCYKDADFPKVFLISFPFSEMLNEKVDRACLRQELSSCFLQLRNNGTKVLAIACNTLHVFLEKEDEQEDFVHLPYLIAEKIDKKAKPLVFCTSTSARFQLHKQFFPCLYPDKETQKEVDQLIDQILKGEEKAELCNKIQALIQKQKEEIIVLGCTDLSLFSSQLNIPNKILIDPLEVMANKVLEKSFLNTSFK